jgi:hypothetical protein
VGFCCHAAPVSACELPAAEAGTNQRRSTEGGGRYHSKIMLQEKRYIGCERHIIPFLPNNMGEYFNNAPSENPLRGEA